MFIAALFTIARTWKQPRCPSSYEWIRKLWYIYTMEYYSAIKNNSFESVLMRWMKMEPIIQSEVSQKDKDQYSILTYIYMEFKKMVTITLYAKQKKTLWEKARVGFSENSIETSILSRVKQISSSGWMHETSVQGWCTGKIQRDGMERESGGGMGSGWETHANPWLKK